MEVQKNVYVETTTRYSFTDDQIADILMRECGVEKSFQSSCEFDVGQVFRGATITVKSSESREN